MEPKGLRVALRIWVGLVLAFLFIPIVLIVLYAFNQSTIESWPISHFTLHWLSLAWHDPEVRAAFWLSVRVGLFATALALLLGSAVAYALYKFRFFRSELVIAGLARPRGSGRVLAVGAGGAVRDRAGAAARLRRRLRAV